MNSILKNVLEQYHNKFGTSPRVMLKSPGRVNLIGEHVDYNGGSVLPIAIDQAIYFCASENKENHWQIVGLDINKEFHSLDVAQLEKWPDWLRYFKNVLQVFESKRYPIKGLNIVFGGDLPIGAGLSSSSDLTCGFIGLCNEIFDLQLSKDEMVSLASQAENGTGVQGGQMDQNAIIYGRKDQALLLDCHQMTRSYIPLGHGSYSWLLFDSGVTHNLADTAYNQRRAECDSALHNINAKLAKKLDFIELEIDHLELLDNDAERRRIQHFIQENHRVEKFCKALVNSDNSSIIKLLNESHHSLSHLYEVSCKELDFIASYIQDQGYGARMMGGGFGGTVLAYLPTEAAYRVEEALVVTYRDTFGLEADLIPITASDGMGII